MASAALQSEPGLNDMDLLRVHAAWPERYPYLLESVAYGSPHARYDVLFAAAEQEPLVLHPDGRVCGPHAKADGFLAALDRWWKAEFDPTSGEGPFQGGWFLYLGYELAGEIEPRLCLPPVAGDLPVAFAARCPAGLLRERSSGQISVVAEAGHEGLAERLWADVQRAPELRPKQRLQAGTLHEDPPDNYLRAVERILEYIRAGDVFQVNVARAWHGHLQEGDSVAMYRALRRSNPAPFAGLARYQGSAIISSSPERLVEVRGDRIQTRPIAGTRPRGPKLRDEALSGDLLAHPKERAEHIMLIDMERNDLGRVCRPGSVEVSELMVVESFAHVHHLVSNVTGQMKAGVTPAEVIRAVFPGGTITGCPKVRCMEIIAELEGVGRGPYTGAMGYLNRNGDLDLNILIRSLLQQGSEISLSAGAGIVADSMPERELHETRAKARGLLLALGAVEP